MTYHYKYFSAFREEDLLRDGDTNVNVGDTFVMPGTSTVTLASYDNDGQLSGDHYDQATDSDGAYDQYGWVNDGSGWHQTGDLYVEKTFTLRGSDGKVYVLAEIEGEGHNAAGVGDDYFSFVGAVPPAGVTLTVESCSNSHGVNYADLSADAPAHVNNAPTFDNLPDNGVIHLDENEAHVIDINASDADGDHLTYSIVGGADANFFAIDPATGDLCFKNAPDFENPLDGGANNVYDVTVQVTDGNGGTTTKTLWVKIQDVDEHVNTAPVFDNLPGNGVLCVDENGTMVIDINASDVDNDNLTFSITGGADAGAFTIDPHTGQLKFASAPDYENPHDGNGDNTYDVTVTVTDGNGGVTTKPLWVKVKDVDENTGGGDLECIIIEAEDMDLYQMSVQHGSQASGGELVRTSHLGGQGDLSTTFNGQGGTYDLSIFAQDETDGQSSIMVKINGVLVEAFKLDNDTDGVGSNNGGFSEFVVEGLDLNAGDEIMIWVDGDAGEWVRIDKIKLQQTEEVNPDLVCLDFEGLAAGTVVNQQFDGVMISAQRDGEGGSNSNSPNDAMIFDSNNPTGGDHDLETANQNNILIVSEDNDSSDPDDNAGGGTIWFKFDNPAFIDSIKVVDAEEGGKIRLLDENGQLIEEVAIPGGVDGGIQTVDINVDGVAQIDLTLNGSGAIDDLKYIPGEAPELGSIAGTYFMDNNDNDIQDAADMGLAGQTVWLLEVGVGIVAQTTTDANGDYIFNDLEAGDYFVRFDGNNVDGKTLVESNVGNDDTVDSDIANTGGAGNHNTAVISLGAGENVTDVDAGVEDPGTASIAGRVFMDNNDNSLDDAGDMGLGGIEIQLRDENLNLLAVTETEADGSYIFEGLDAGQYIVDLEQNDADLGGKVIVTQDVDGNVSDDIDSDVNAAGWSQVIDLSIGENVIDVDAGVEDPDTASIAGRYFCDENTDDVDNGEPGISGALVTLLDANGNPATDAAGNTITTTTDANGNYSFTGLAAGTYGVLFAADAEGKSFVAQNDPNGNGDDTNDSDVDGNGVITGITVGIGDASNDNDAGVEDPGTASLGGRIFMDSDGDSQDNGNGDEAPAPGVTVRLLDADGNELATTTTDANGEYLFDNLDAGDYRVDFPLEVDGKVLVEQNVGNDVSDSDASQATGETGVISLAIGEDVRDVDAGVEDPGTAAINGRLFMDNNDNSIEDGADMGLGGIEVELLNAQGVVIATTTTNGNGEYSFTGLGAGDYAVSFPEEVDGKVLVEQNVGLDDTVDSDANQNTGVTDTISLDVGEVSDDNDAGVEDPGTAAITGSVFMDNNDNSIDDAGDMAVAGVPVDLLNDADEVIASTTTGPDGGYSFTGLDAGTYSVTFPTEVNGKVLVDSNAGPDDVDSDADQTSGNTGPITVGIGETSENNDAGIEDPGTAAIGDRVFLDTNGNGRQDDGESGVAGVGVTVRDADGNIVGTDTTDGQGNYLVGGLDAGSYTVEFEEVDGFDFTTANAAGVDDAQDSDADETTGISAPVSVGIGETNRTVDAGLVEENAAPEATDDEGMVCATETVSINVLDNDSDADGDTLSVAHVNGVELAAGESTTLDSGAVVTLNDDGTLSYDSSNAVIDGTAAADIVLGDVATDSFTYSITDGNGGTDTGEVNVTLKGGLNTIDTILSSAPTSGTATFSGFDFGIAYTATLSNTGDARYDGLTIEAAYCLERDADYLEGIEVAVDISGALDSIQNAGDFVSDVDGNLDLINWIINQDFTSQDNGDGTGTNYTDAEIQSAIWGITDDNSAIFEFPTNGTQANVQEIIDLAEANGEGYIPGEGDLFTLVLNPTDVQPGASEDTDHDQSFIIALSFDDFKEDCIC